MADQVPDDEGLLAYGNLRFDHPYNTAASEQLANQHHQDSLSSGIPEESTYDLQKHQQQQPHTPSHDPIAYGHVQHHTPTSSHHSPAQPHVSPQKRHDLRVQQLRPQSHVQQPSPQYAYPVVDGSQSLMDSSGSQYYRSPMQMQGVHPIDQQMNMGGSINQMMPIQQSQDMSWQYRQMDYQQQQQQQHQQHEPQQPDQRQQLAQLTPPGIPQVPLPVSQSSQSQQQQRPSSFQQQDFMYQRQMITGANQQHQQIQSSQQMPQQSPSHHSGHRQHQMSVQEGTAQHPFPLPSPPHQPQPFNYTPTIASTVPVHSNPRANRRRKTNSKRSIAEMILDPTVPTSIVINPTGAPQMPHPHRQSIGLISDMVNDSSANPLVGPTFPLNLPEPPLATAQPNPAALQNDAQPRPKKKSKYSPEQDSIILALKKQGKPWNVIAEAAGCVNSLAARNRYQVLIGQQGGGAVVWEAEDTMALQALLEEGEKAKWNFVASELSRLRSKLVHPAECRRRIKEMFQENPSNFGLRVGATVGMPGYGYLPVADMSDAGGFGPLHEY